MTDVDAIRSEAIQVARGWSGPNTPPSWRLTAALFDGIATADELLAAMVDLPAERLPALLASAAIVDLARRTGPSTLTAYLPEPGQARPPFDWGFAPALAEFIAAHGDEVVDICRARRYQMSEVRRSAQVALGLAATVGADASIALVDIGCGAGFGLHLDRYRYVVGEADVVGPEAALTLVCETRGARRPPPVALPTIVERAGIEVDPIDLEDADARAWLLACTPPEPGAIDRVAAAIAIARADPAPIVEGDALAALPGVLAALPAGLPVVVVDSYVAVFLDDDRRRDLAEVLAEAAAERPVRWLALDPLAPLGPAGTDSVQGLAVPAQVLARRAEGVFAVLGHRSFGPSAPSVDGDRPDGVLATAHPSGSWVEWFSG